MLLHNRIDYLCLLLAHLVYLKEDSNSVKMLLDALKYDEYVQEVIRVLKMVVFLMGVQGPFTNSFYYIWENRDMKVH